MGFPKGDKRTGLKARKPISGVKIPTDLIINTIRKCRGNLSRAADKLGCCRQTLYLRVNAEKEIKEVVDECRERFIDDTEDVFQSKVLSGDTVSMLFALKTLGRKRGYDLVERDVVAEGAVRGALEYVFNKSKNPAE